MMDISSVGRISTAATQAQTGDAVSIAVLKKAIDLQAQVALQLVDALPQPASGPSHLGQSVDTFA
jgi:hypothetical protein